jgi:hypothetical protein
MLALEVACERAVAKGIVLQRDVAICGVLALERSALGDSQALKAPGKTLM